MVEGRIRIESPRLTANPRNESMSADASNAANATADPLKSVATAMANAAEAVRDGASDAAAKVQTALPATGKFVSRFVYSTCYFASYGVVFPTLFVANVVPGLGTIADGLTDGAAAASDVVHEMKSKRAAKKAAAQDAECREVNEEGVEACARV
jgi:uncharacterized MAPEG superfamily protein